jgi:serine phosphatase RsbU (regulator of sigma subunit)
VRHDAADPAERHPGGWLLTNAISVLTRGQGRLAAVALALLLACWQGWAGEQQWSAVRERIFDAYQRIFPRQPQRQPVVIVDIDDASLAQLGQWPWPRTRLARLIDTTFELGALAVGLDILMSEPDRSSPSVFIAARPDLSATLRDALAQLPSHDAILAETLRRVPSVVGRVAMSTGERGGLPASQQTPVRVYGDLSIESMPAYGGHLTNVSVIEEAAFGRGYLNATPDADGVVRAVPLLLAIRGALAPSFALELLRVAGGERLYSVHGGARGVHGVQIGTSFIPTDSDGRLRLHYARPGSTDNHRRLSALNIFNSDVKTKFLANHVAIIGVTGVGLTDVWATPAAALMDGVEVQAQVIENILDGARLVRPWLVPWLELGLFLSVAAVLIAFMPRYGLGFGVVALLMAAGALAIGSVMGFVHAKVLLDPSMPVAGNAVILGVLLAAGSVAADQKRRELHAALEAARLEQVHRDGELQAARDIQLGIVPSPGAIVGLPGHLAFHALLKPAKEVGGDLYDAFMLDAHHFCFLVGDVAGKGVPASLFMALSKTLLKHIALREQVPLATLMTLANAAISRDNPANLFVTALAGIIDVRTGIMELCSAGHEGPILLRAGEAPRVLDVAGGPALCVLEDFSYDVERGRLCPGDMLIMITDGVTEAQDPAQQFYGIGRVLAWLTDRQETHAKWPSVEAICSGLYADVNHFANGAVPADDITIMAIHFNEPLPPTPSSPSG